MTGKASTSEQWGVLAEFAGAPEIFQACETVRDAGYARWDAHTPFPVHGLDRAMGLRPSRLPWIVFIAGMLGAASGMLLQWWTSAVDYPLVIAGKPLFSWPAFVPVTFEVGVLFAAFAALLSMLHFNRLPRLHHPIFSSERFSRVSDDRFFISIEASDPNFDESQTTALLQQAGATHVETLRE